MNIAGRDLKKVRILIAELGSNHEGDPVLALEMAVAAIEAGADAVKVQIIVPEKLMNRNQIERISQLTKFQLSMDTFIRIGELVHQKSRLFIASVFDLDSLALILPYLDSIKIASGDLDFTPLLIDAAASGKPTIISTGMATLEEIRDSINVIDSHLPENQTISASLALLHCISLYPTPSSEANLRLIPTLAQMFNLTTGYSDHTLGIESAIISLALDARIIEKHFTIDKTRKTFRDHALSVDPIELRRLAEIVHGFDQIIGSGEKIISPAEAEMTKMARRSIVAARDLPAGKKLSDTDLDCLRPRAAGLAPQKLSLLLGRSLRIPLNKHDSILEEHLV